MIFQSQLVVTILSYIGTRATGGKCASVKLKMSLLVRPLDRCASRGRLHGHNICFLDVGAVRQEHGEVRWWPVDTSPQVAEFGRRPRRWVCPAGQVYPHLSVICFRMTRRTRFYICPSPSVQRTPAENKNIVPAGPSQSGRPSCVNTMVARICRPHVGHLLHKQCVGRCDLVTGPADIFSHKRDLFFVNHACG